MKRQTTLFDCGDSSVRISAPRTEPLSNRLVQSPVRNQVAMPLSTLDDLVGKDHSVRAIAGIVESLDLRVLDARIASTRDVGGRPAIEPRVLLSLWIYGTSQGEAFASEIARRTRTDDVYRWLCGGVDVSERALGMFRKSGASVFDALLTQVLGVLMNEGLIDLHRVAQDGTRVRASAAASSFNRKSTLEIKLFEARAHVAALKAMTFDPARSRAARVAAERAAEDRTSRIERAIARVTQLVEGKDPAIIDDEKKSPRVSTTDPECTRMKMPDGGFRPAYNVQFATVGDGSGVIVGVDVTTRGNDFGEIEAMVDQVAARTGERPNEVLVDGGYMKLVDIEAVENKGSCVFAPEPKKKASDAGRTASERSTTMIGFFERIESADGKAIYSHRGEVAELSNAHAKSRYGLSTILLRSLRGALTMALMVALTKDILTLAKLRSARDAKIAMTDAATRP